MRLLAVDPGKANGWALFEGGKLLDSGTATQEELYLRLETERLDVVVFESYRLYATHSKQMIGDDFLTPQIIGVIKFVCSRRRIEVFEQPATTKAYYNDERLREMGLYFPVDHRRDAIRHGLYFMHFGKGKGRS